MIRLFIAYYLWNMFSISLNFDDFIVIALSNHIILRSMVFLQWKNFVLVCLSIDKNQIGFSLNWKRQKTFIVILINSFCFLASCIFFIAQSFISSDQITVVKKGSYFNLCNEFSLDLSNQSVCVFVSKNLMHCHTKSRNKFLYVLKYQYLIFKNDAVSFVCKSDITQWRFFFLFVFYVAILLGVLMLGTTQTANLDQCSGSVLNFHHIPCVSYMKP